MNTNEQLRAVTVVRDRFLRSGTTLPSNVLGEGVRFVGFADEVTLRQSADFCRALKRFLNDIGDDLFFFMWLDSHIKPEDALTVASTEALQQGTDLVSLQVHISDEVLAGGDAWLAASFSASWGIYGEHFGSEMAIFMATSDDVHEAMRSAFSAFLMNASDALKELGDPTTAPPDGEFSRQLLNNYPS